MDYFEIVIAMKKPTDMNLALSVQNFGEKRRKKKKLWHAHKILKILMSMIRPKKKNCYVALTRPKFENWVGRSGFFFFFFFTYRERVEFSNIFF